MEADTNPHPWFGPVGWRRLAVLLAVVGPAFAMARISWLHGNDDSYITFAAARRFLEGGDLRGATSPLYALLLALLERLAPLGLPSWAWLVGWTAILWTSGRLLAIGDREGWPRGAILLAIAWPLWPWTVRYPGMEWPVALALFVTATSTALGRRALPTAAGLATAVALRPEVGLGAALLAGVDTVAGGRERIGWWLRVGVASLTGWALWLLGLRWVAGVALPGTLEAKRAQAESPFTFWHGGEIWLRKLWSVQKVISNHEWTTLLLGCAVLGLGTLVAAWRSGARERPVAATTLVLWSLGLVLAYTASGAPFYPWYAVPIQLGLLVAATRVAEIGRGPGAGRGAVVAGGLMTVTLCVGLVAMMLPWVERHRRGPLDAREEQYRSVAEWIGERYGDEVRVASVEVGFLGWYGSFETVDLLGLATPSVPLDAIRDGRLDRVVDTLDPDLLLLPAQFVELGRSMVGDPRDFLEARRLDHVDVDGFPSVFLYRRVGRPARGDVLEDLVARGPAAVVWASQGRFGAPAAVVPAGGNLELEIQTDRAARVRWTLVPKGRKRVRLLAGRAGEPRTRYVSARRPVPGSIPLEPGAPSRLRWTCRGPEGSECRLAVLHVESREGLPSGTGRPTITVTGTGDQPRQ